MEIFSLIQNCLNINTNEHPFPRYAGHCVIALGKHTQAFSGCTEFGKTDFLPTVEIDAYAEFKFANEETENAYKGELAISFYEHKEILVAKIKLLSRGEYCG